LLLFYGLNPQEKVLALKIKFSHSKWLDTNSGSTGQFPGEMQIFAIALIEITNINQISNI